MVARRTRKTAKTTRRAAVSATTRRTTSKTTAKKARRHGGGMSELGIVRRADPKRWARIVARAVRSARGFLDVAAAKLGVSRRTLQKWINEEELLADVRALKHPGGRPRKQT